MLGEIDAPRRISSASSPATVANERAFVRSSRSSPHARARAAARGALRRVLAGTADANRRRDLLNDGRDYRRGDHGDANKAIHYYERILERAVTSQAIYALDRLYEAAERWAEPRGSPTSARLQLAGTADTTVLNCDSERAHESPRRSERRRSTTSRRCLGRLVRARSAAARQACLTHPDLVSGAAIILEGVSRSARRCAISCGILEVRLELQIQTTSTWAAASCLRRHRGRLRDERLTDDKGPSRPMAGCSRSRRADVRGAQSPRYLEIASASTVAR